VEGLRRSADPRRQPDLRFLPRYRTADGQKRRGGLAEVAVPPGAEHDEIAYRGSISCRPVASEVTIPILNL